MRCRRIIKQPNGTYYLVWFGCKSTTLQTDDKICGAPYTYAHKSEFFNENNKHDNYSSGQQGLTYSLIQRLSVLQHELWYDYENGMPIIDKTKSKAVIDAYVIKTILNHPDVISIEEFESNIEQHSYSCNVKINSVFGVLELSI